MTTDSPIVIYDSDCMLCSRAIRFVLRYELDNQLVFTDFQSAIANSIGVKSEVLDTLLFYDNGQVLNKSHAAFAIARYLKSPWRWLSHFQILPRMLTDGVYDIIARNRYRMLGKVEDSCLLSDDLAERFIA